MNIQDKQTRIQQLKQDYRQAWRNFDTWEIRLDMSFNPFAEYDYTECVNMMWALNDELADIESALRKLGVPPEDISNG